MTFRCEWQALHGARCSHQCDDCKDEDAHPPALPPLVIGTAEDCPWKCKPDATSCLCRVPLDLAPAQPARCGGTET